MSQRLSYDSHIQFALTRKAWSWSEWCLQNLTTSLKTSDISSRERGSAPNLGKSYWLNLAAV